MHTCTHTHTHTHTHTRLMNSCYKLPSLPGNPAHVLFFLAHNIIGPSTMLALYPSLPSHSCGEIFKGRIDQRRGHATHSVSSKIQTCQLEASSVYCWLCYSIYNHWTLLHKRTLLLFDIISDAKSILPSCKYSRQVTINRVSYAVY